MNKIYKLVWSQAKNMYVAVCEFAKSHTKVSRSSVISRAVITGVLASVLSFGAVIPADAAVSTSIPTSGPNSGSSAHDIGYQWAEQYFANQCSNSGGVVVDVVSIDNANLKKIALNSAGFSNTTGGWYNGSDYAYVPVNNNKMTYYLVTESNGNKHLHALVWAEEFSSNEERRIRIDLTSADLANAGININTLGNAGSSYTAGNGIAISSDNKISAIAGTGITVNSSGISITAGSVAAGNANAITGGTAYSELRASANGNYVNPNIHYIEFLS